ncbi:MAG: metal-sensing transcriptional repressor [Clostridiales bacterium]|nr:metal-sensing transcriptional repressor [Clostridiales bacterium]
MVKITEDHVQNAAQDEPQNAAQDQTKETDATSCCCNTCKTKERSPEEYRSLMNRLTRIEGQVRGVQRMLARDAYCVDILIQVSAINSALNSFNKELLGNHIRSCVVENVRSGNDEVIDELVKTIQKLMK